MVLEVAQSARLARLPTVLVEQLCVDVRVGAGASRNSHASVAARACVLLAMLLACAGCLGSPTPLAPALRGSVGVPHRGVITDARALPARGDGYRRLRDDAVRWGNPKLVSAIEAAARDVASLRPGGAPLIVGDLSARWGGEASGHRSHRTGRDADLLLYSVTPDARSVATPGFVRFGADGLARSGRAFLRIDIERQWLLVRALVQSPEADMQWLFVARWLEAMIIEYALARGEDPELVWQAENLLLQPTDSAAHDDHLHVRIGCSPEEAVAGCLGGGPRWPWLDPHPALGALSDGDLLHALVEDAGAGNAGSSDPATSTGPAALPGGALRVSP
jgi:penicillin-insensitive murein DD-endopeptidase